MLPGNDSYESYDYGYYDDTTTYIKQTLSPIFLTLGSVGNVVSAVVLYRLSQEILPTCLYMAVLAVAELFVLYSRCGNTWLASVSELDIINTLMMNSLSICKVYPFIFSFMFHLLRWLVVCTAVEGAMITTNPHRLQRSLSTSRAEAAMLLLTVVLVSLNMHFFWSFELIKPDNGYMSAGTVCKLNVNAHRASELFGRYIWPAIDIVVTDVAPIAIVTVCSCIMLAQVARGRHHGNEEYRAWRSRYQMEPQALDQLVMIILIVCVGFVPATLPKMVINTTSYVYELEGLFMDYGRIRLLNAVFTNVEYAFLSLKFFLYLALSARFRLEVTTLVKCSRCYDRHRVLPRLRHTESMANEPLMNQDGCQRSATDTSLHQGELPI